MRILLIFYPAKADLAEKCKLIPRRFHLAN